MYMRPNFCPVHSNTNFKHQDVHLQLSDTLMGHGNADHVGIHILSFYGNFSPCVPLSLDFFVFFRTFRSHKIHTKLEFHTGYVGVVSASSTRGHLYPSNRRRLWSSLLSHPVLIPKAIPAVTTHANQNINYAYIIYNLKEKFHPLAHSGFQNYCGLET